MLNKVYPAGSVICLEGEEGHCAYIVLRGSVEISSTRQGRKISLSTLGPQELFGELSLIDNQVRSATATALEETEVVLIHSDQLINRLEGIDPVITLLIDSLLRGFRSSHNILQGDGGLPPTPTASKSPYTVVDGVEELICEQDLRQAIAEGRPEPYFQPVVTLKDRSLAGFEALVRLPDADGEIVPPDDFIGVAERSGLIRQIDTLMLNKVCRILSDSDFGNLASQTNAKPLFVGINLSALHFSDEVIVGEVEKVLKETNLDPACLKFEVTESAILENPNTASRVLSKLKDLGASIALDDFGTGYSSLSYLTRLPIDTLKIDRSFINKSNRSEDSTKIIQLIIGLAKMMDLKVIAEGVEDEDTVALLLGLGCDCAQGYLFGRPMPATSLEAMIAGTVR